MILIDANELKKWFKARMALWRGVNEVLDKIDDAPTVEAKDAYHLSCNRCGKEWLSKVPFTPKCPFCGNEEYWW